MNKKDRDFDFVAYTDGGYSIQRNVGASACVVLSSNRKKILYKWSKALRNSTNNRQELGAIIHVVLSIPDGSRVKIYSDSQYSIGVLSGKMKPKTNTDLVDYFRQFCAQRGVEVAFSWVQGHNGDVWNEEVDQMCTTAMDALLMSGRKIIESRNTCDGHYKELLARRAVGELDDALEELLADEEQ